MLKPINPDFVAGVNEPDINDPTTQRYGKQFIEKFHANVRERNSATARPPFGLTAVIGTKGSGKTLTAAWLARVQYQRGVEVFYTPTTGLRFGVEIANVKTDEESALNELYAFAIGKKNCVVVIDELQVYLNKWGQNAMGHQLFIDGLAALRKNGIHLIYTCQHDGQISSDLEVETTCAYFPRKMPYKEIADPRKRRRTYRPPEFEGIPGKYNDLKIQIDALSGPTALSFNHSPNKLMMFEGRSLPRPKRERFRIPYQDAVETALLYNSWSELQVGARFKSSAKKVREALE